MSLKHTKMLTVCGARNDPRLLTIYPVELKNRSLNRNLATELLLLIFLTISRVIIR